MFHITFRCRSGYNYISSVAITRLVNVPHTELGTDIQKVACALNIVSLPSLSHDDKSFLYNILDGSLRQCTT